MVLIGVLRIARILLRLLADFFNAGEVFLPLVFDGEHQQRVQWQVEVIQQHVAAFAETH